MNNFEFINYLKSLNIKLSVQGDRLSQMEIMETREI